MAPSVGPSRQLNNNRENLAAIGQISEGEQTEKVENEKEEKKKKASRECIFRYEGAHNAQRYRGKML